MIVGCTETAAIHQTWGTVEEVVLEARIDGWVGIHPDTIEGETNPTLTLYEGNKYDFTWRNGDGESHSLVFIDETGSRITEKAELSETEGDTRTLTVTAGSRMAEFVCNVHPETERGTIDIQFENDNDGHDASESLSNH